MDRAAMFAQSGWPGQAAVGIFRAAAGVSDAIGFGTDPAPETGAGDFGARIVAEVVATLVFR